MSTRHSGAELAELGFDISERDLFFLIEHPEFKGRSDHLRATYTTCQVEKIGGRRGIELDEAYTHVFGNRDDNHGCPLCRENLEVLKSIQEKFTRE